MSEENINITPAEDDSIVYANIVLEDDGYHVIDRDGTKGEVCKIVDDGKTIALTKNASNRKWYNMAKANAAIEANGQCPLYYKATKTVGPRTASSGVRDPLKKLVPYMSDEDKAKYEEIMKRAVAAMEADRNKPKTELEKAEEALAKAQAKLAALIAAQQGDTEEAE